MRLIAVDLGDQRTGLALGDTLTGLALPHQLINTPISRDHGDALLKDLAHAVRDALGDPRAPDPEVFDWPALAEPLARRDPDALRAAHALARHDAIVLGLPINMDSSQGPRAALVRAFARRLAHACNRPVVLFDERLTSADADWQLARSGLTHRQKKARRDALAAAAILTEFINALRAACEQSP